MTDTQAAYCVICSDELTLKNVVNSICGHQQCKDCFWRWAKTSNQCPFCRKDLGNIKVYSPYLDEEIKESLIIRLFRMIINFFNWIIALLFIILIFGIILPFGFGILILTVIYCLDLNNKMILFDYINNNIFWSWVYGFITTLILTSLCSSKLKKRRLFEQNNRRGRVGHRVMTNVTQTVF